MSRSRRAEAPVISEAQPLNAELLRSWIVPLDPTADKLERGTVLVLGGSLRTAGAVVLSGLAALRAGAGRLQIATVEPLAHSLAAAVPEALVEGLACTASGAIDPTDVGERLHERLSGAQAVLMGPGFDDLPSATALLAEVIPRIDPGVVVAIDALALSAMPLLPSDIVEPLRGRLAFTPNRQEAHDLLDSSSDLTDTWEIASLAAERYGAVITMEGHVVSPDGRRWLADERIPGLGMGGSGDVLAGLVAGGAAHCDAVVPAVCRATYLHLEAGRSAGERIGEVGFLARELLEFVPRIMADITTSPRRG